MENIEVTVEVSTENQETIENKETLESVEVVQV